jgi:hypothetical protein
MCPSEGLPAAAAAYAAIAASTGLAEARWPHRMSNWKPQSVNQLNKVVDSDLAMALL